MQPVQATGNTRPGFIKMHLFGLGESGFDLLCHRFQTLCTLLLHRTEAAGAEGDAQQIM